MKPLKATIIEWGRWYPGTDVKTGYPPNLGYCITGFKDETRGELGPKLSNAIRTSLVVAERPLPNGDIEVESLNSLYILVKGMEANTAKTLSSPVSSPGQG